MYTVDKFFLCVLASFDRCMKAYDIGFVCLNGVVDNNDEDGDDDEYSSCNFLLIAYNVTKWVLIK